MARIVKAKKSTARKSAAKKSAAKNSAAKKQAHIIARAKAKKAQTRKTAAPTPRKQREVLFIDDAMVMPQLSADLRDASRFMGRREIRTLVDSFYIMQKARIVAGNISGALDKANEPHRILDYVAQMQERLENQIHSTLDVWSSNNTDCHWLREIVGVGPVISSGLTAHIDISRAATAGALWRFAGLDPTAIWLPKTKRPWNARLKLLAWKAGQSFVKFAANERCYYGHLYTVRRELEDLRNARGDYANEAVHVLLTRNFRSMANTRMKNATDAEKEKEIQTTVSWYKKGMFPPGRIQLRATRYACTIFLSHLHDVMFFNTYNHAAPRPYVYDYRDHAHIIEPPYLEKFPDIAKAIRARTPTVDISRYVNRMMRDHVPAQPTNIPNWFNGRREIPSDLLQSLQAQNPRRSGDDPFEEFEGQE
jgi:hypothetical protein